jgi:hypothetical protein
MRKLLVLIILAVVVTGCSSRKDFYATGGSRADGSIDMAYDFKPFERPVVDYKQAESIANNKCAVWGYTRAEPFGGQTQNCHVRDGWGNCTGGQMIVKYQCIGNITPTTEASASTLPSVPVGMLTPAQYKESRVKALMDQHLPYTEYQKQYQAIMAE